MRVVKDRENSQSWPRDDWAEIFDKWLALALQRRGLDDHDWDLHVQFHTDMEDRGGGVAHVKWMSRREWEERRPVVVRFDTRPLWQIMLAVVHEVVHIEHTVHGYLLSDRDSEDEGEAKLLWHGASFSLKSREKLEAMLGQEGLPWETEAYADMDRAMDELMPRLEESDRLAVYRSMAKTQVVTRGIADRIRRAERISAMVDVLRNTRHRPR